MNEKTFSRREFLWVAAGTAAGAVLAACQPAAAPEPEEPEVEEPEVKEPEVEEPPVEEPEAPEPIELEFWDWDYTPRVEFTEQLVAEFMEENPDITLKYNPLGWTDIETKLLTVATAGTGPAFSNVHYFWRYDLQRAGILSPYPEEIFDWDKLVSTPFNRDAETGEIYTCDFCFYCEMVMYNTALLDAEGLTPDDIPSDWDGFMALAQQLTKTDSSGKIEQVGCSLNDYWAREWLWHTLVYQQGAWLYNEDASEALWNSDESVKALEFIGDFYHKYQVDDAEFLSHYDAFGNQKAAMTIDQGYMVAPFDGDFPDLAGNWGTTTTPTFSGDAPPSWGMALPEEGFCVFNTFPVEVQEAAFKYIEHMLRSDERRLDWAVLMSGPPDRIDLLDHPRIKDEQLVGSISAQADTMPWRVIYGERPLEAEKFWRTMFDEVTLEDKDPKEVLDSATEQMNAAFAESGEKRYIVERNFTPPS